MGRRTIRATMSRRNSAADTRVAPASSSSPSDGRASAHPLHAIKPPSVIVIVSVPSQRRGHLPGSRNERTRRGERHAVSSREHRPSKKRSFAGRISTGRGRPVPSPRPAVVALQLGASQARDSPLSDERLRRRNAHPPSIPQQATHPLGPALLTGGQHASALAGVDGRSDGGRGPLRRDFIEVLRCFDELRASALARCEWLGSPWNAASRRRRDLRNPGASLA